MATVNLGSIKFNWKGAYSGATAYVVDDVVESSGSSYICIAATTGNAPPNASYWEQMSSAGTNGTDGTDLGTTLTTQGDIVYRDASGLARLGAGTSGQVLQSGGTGANPSWTNVASDYVKLAETTITTNTNPVSFDGYFTSDYDRYEIICSDFVTSGDGDLWFRVRTGNSDNFGNYYANNNSYLYTDTTPSNNIGTQSSGSNDYNDESNFWKGNGDDFASGKKHYLHFTIHDPLNTTDFKMMEYRYGYGVSSSNTVIQQPFGFGVFKLTTALTGLSVFPSSGDFTGGTFKLYGLK